MGSFSGSLPLSLLHMESTQVLASERHWPVKSSDDLDFLPLRVNPSETQQVSSFLSPEDPGGMRPGLFDENIPDLNKILRAAGEWTLAFCFPTGLERLHKHIWGSI